MIDLTPLYIAIVDQLVLIVPVLGTLAIAWVARRIALLKAVDEACDRAEEQFGPDGNKAKHAVVTRKVSETWPMTAALPGAVDRLVAKRGPQAGERAKRKSVAP